MQLPVLLLLFNNWLLLLPPFFLVLIMKNLKRCLLLLLLISRSQRGTSVCQSPYCRQRSLWVHSLDFPHFFIVYLILLLLFMRQQLLINENTPLQFTPSFKYTISWWVLQWAPMWLWIVSSKRLRVQSTTGREKAVRCVCISSYCDASAAFNDKVF